MKTKLFLMAGAIVAISASSALAQDTTITNLNVDSSMTIGTFLNVGEKISSRDGSFERDVKVQGNLILEQLMNLTLHSDEMLLVDPATGIVKSGDILAQIYTEQTAACKDQNGGYTTPVNGQWLNGPGTLYTNRQCNPDVKVGIGEENPKAKLHITLNNEAQGVNTPAMLVEQANGWVIMKLTEEGQFMAREIILNDSVWADYVFDENYKLMPLNEVDTYIKKNGHLPNVPSSSDIANDGINVAKTEVMLLEKVEELTLYILQLQRVVELQQAQINSLIKTEPKQ